MSAWLDQVRITKKPRTVPNGRSPMALGFAQLIRDRRPDEIQTVMEVAKAALKGMSRARKK